MNISSFSYPSKGILVKINALKGELGQMICASDYLSEGFTIIPTGHGSDYFVAKIPQEITKKLYGTLVETKTGNSRLTKLQKKTKRNSRNQNVDYTINRVSDAYLKKFIENIAILITFIDADSKEENKN